MLLYLVQHAEALSKEEDPSRSLSEKGIADVKKVAAFAASLDITVKKICHSGKMRALQTAQILAERLTFDKGLTKAEGLEPMDDPEVWLSWLGEMKEDMAVVGHLPHLSRLSSLLLCGDKEKNLIDFKMGGVVCLKGFEDGKWTVEWMITPEMIK